jgi:hypothetical protein
VLSSPARGVDDDACYYALTSTSAPHLGHGIRLGHRRSCPTPPRTRQVPSATFGTTRHRRVNLMPEKQSTANVVLRTYQRSRPWARRCVGASLRGRVAAWARRCVGASLRGRVASWARRVASWARRVAAWRVWFSLGGILMDTGTIAPSVCRCVGASRCWARRVVASRRWARRVVTSLHGRVALRCSVVRRSGPHRTGTVKSVAPTQSPRG